MSAAAEPISILDRRKIEAQIAGPLIKAFIEEVGEEMEILHPRGLDGYGPCDARSLLTFAAPYS